MKYTWTSKILTYEVFQNQPQQYAGVQETFIWHASFHPFVEDGISGLGYLGGVEAIISDDLLFCSLFRWQDRRLTVPFIIRSYLQNPEHWCKLHFPLAQYLNSGLIPLFNIRAHLQERKSSFKHIYWLGIHGYKLLQAVFLVQGSWKGEVESQLLSDVRQTIKCYHALIVWRPGEI